MKKSLLFCLSILVVMTLACNLSGNSTPASQGAGATPQGGGNQPPSIFLAKGTPESKPVNLNEGLASLNSYQMVIKISGAGPDPADTTSLMLESQHSQDNDAYLTKISNNSTKKGESSSSDSTSEIYQIGNDQCSVNGTDASWSSMKPNEAEMVSKLMGMMGMTPLIEKPTFVAEETVNGIPSNHFTFQASGLGVKSGATVNINQGDYWLAKDGQYVVKYLLIMETATDPQTVLHEEVSIEMTQVNQPVSIAFPQNCLDASKVTPTP